MTGRTRFAIILTFAVSATLAPAASTHAAITLNGFTSWASNGNPSNSTFNAGGSDKLVVVISGEHNFPGNYTGDIYSVKYDGQLLTKAVEQAPSSALGIQTTSDIWYLDNPWQYHTAGAIVVSVNGNGTNYVYTAVGLSGTLAGVGATAHVSGTSALNLTTTGANSMVLFSLATGGSGNTASGTNTILPNSPVGAVQIDGKVSTGNYAGQSVARASVASPGPLVFSFSTTKTDVATIAAEFLPDIPHLLSLRINTATGVTTLLGDPTRGLSVNYYQITSAAHSLSAANWSSLADQDFDGHGPPNGSGNGWEEAGGAGPHALAEAYLLGSSTIAAAGSIGLGRGYDTAVNARDVAFTYRTGSGAIVDGPVQYVTPYSGTWKTAGNGSWATSASWTETGGTQHKSPGMSPGSQEQAVLGTIGGASAIQITLDPIQQGQPTRPSLSSLVFQGSGTGYTIAPGTGGKLLLEGAGGSTIAVSGTATHAIQAAMTLGADTYVTTDTGSKLTLSGNLDGAGKLAKIGGGTLLLSGTNTFGGGTEILGGRLVVAGAKALPDGLSLSIRDGAALVFGGPPQTGPEAVSAQPVPEPGTLVLLFSALLVGLCVRRKN